MTITLKWIKGNRKTFLGIFLFSVMILQSIYANAQSIPKAPSFFGYSYLFSFPTKKGEGVKAIGKPRNLAINSGGQIYIVVPYAKEVRVYNLKGEYRFSFGMKINVLLNNGSNDSAFLANISPGSRLTFTVSGKLATIFLWVLNDLSPTKEDKCINLKEHPD